MVAPLPRLKKSDRKNLTEELPEKSLQYHELFSNLHSKGRSGMKYDALEAQMMADAREALRKYGETLDIRRDSLQPLLRHGSQVPVSRIRLIYEGGKLNPKNVNDLKVAVSETEAMVPEVKVSVQ